jgi:gliding motility associated protien GldN
MNKQIVKLALLVAVMGGMALTADAQRRGRTRNQSTTTPAPDTTSQQVNNVNRQPSGYNPYGNVPIKTAPSSGGFTDSTKPSLRNDAAYEKLGMKDRTPLAYDHLRLDDALFTERVWREIDTREKINQVFNYKAEDDNGAQQFIQILVKAVRDKKVTAFNADDDRFTTPLDSVAFEKVLSGGSQCDTLPVYDLIDPTKIKEYTVVCNSMNPDDIVKFRIKEDWVFDRESSRLVCRILGIAPLKTILGVDKKTEKGAQPMFWIYYPDIRATLTKYEVYNPKNMGQSRMTWEELFESRMFGSYIVKSTMDNPQNRFIRNYVKDPILALLEGDNIKDKIFNYEQDLWSY